jgi:hypothetical protein
MSISFKTTGRMLLLTLLGCWTLSGLFASPNRNAAARVNPVQKQSDQDISGQYKGLALVFRDKGQSQCLMAGMAKLDIDGKQFTLTNSQGKTLKGEITTILRTDKENLAVGQLTLENEKTEIRWHLNPRSNILKIFSAAGANRYFRFCSANLTQYQCFGRV